VRCLKRNNWRRWKLKQMFGNTIPTIRSLIAAPVPPRHSMTVGGPAPLQSRAPRPGPRWRLAPGSPPQTPRGGAQPNRAPRIGRRIGPQEAQRGGSGPLTSHPERPSLNERPGRDADVGEGHLGVVALLPEHGHRAHHPHAAGGAVRRGGGNPLSYPIVAGCTGVPCPLGTAARRGSEISLSFRKVWGPGGRRKSQWDYFRCHFGV